MKIIKKIAIIVSVFFVLISLITFVLLISNNDADFIINTYEMIFGKLLFGLLYPFITGVVFSPVEDSK